MDVNENRGILRQVLAIQLDTGIERRPNTKSRAGNHPWNWLLVGRLVSQRGNVGNFDDRPGPLPLFGCQRQVSAQHPDEVPGDGQAGAISGELLPRVEWRPVVEGKNFVEVFLRDARTIVGDSQGTTMMGHL